MESKYGYYGDWPVDIRDFANGTLDSGQQEKGSNLTEGDFHLRKPTKPTSMKDVSSIPSSPTQKFAADRKGRTLKADDRDGQHPSTESGKRKSILRIFKRFAENCSMQGPPYIIYSTWWLSRFLWTVLFLAALGAMSFHLLYLCQTYFSYPTKNQISMGFSSLQFPAVTVCNANPLQISRIGALSPDFRNLVTLVDPQNIGRAIDTLPPRPAFNQAGRRKKRRQATHTTPPDYDSDFGDDYDSYDTALDNIDLGLSATNFSNSRAHVDNLNYDKNGYGDSWESESSDSNFHRMQQNFRQLYATENRAARVKAGHNMDDMLISCTFAGRSCYPNNFTLTNTAVYGNCFTLQYNKFISRESGPSGGLELQLFLDTDEYIQGIVPDDGLQVSIHPQRSMAFPEDQGMAVPAASHTMLSLKLVEIGRKGKPYGTCNDNENYLNDYNVLYTRQTCFKFCEQAAIHARCRCRDELAEELNIVMKAMEYQPCRQEADVRCMLEVQWDYQQGKVKCDCSDPCNEVKYEKSMSFRPWPNKEYAQQVLLRRLCRRVPAAKCAALQRKDPQDLAREFVKLDIFYEGLNYESISQEADYESVQFVSDVGGTLGLWVGVSVLSVMEIVQLFVELFRYFCCCRWCRRS